MCESKGKSENEKISLREAFSFIYKTDEGTRAFVLGMYCGLIFSLIIAFLITLTQMVRLL